MGDRGQVKILPQDKNEHAIFLYTHWGASELPQTVQAALKRRQRWDDLEYLARIIFCEMAREDFAGEVGYGIGTAKHGDVWRIVEVDVRNQKIRIFDHDEPKGSYSFDEFCKLVM